MSVTNPNFNPSGNETVAAIKNKALELANLVEALPNGRRKSIALTQIEQASMWAVKAAVVGDNE